MVFLPLCEGGSASGSSARAKPILGWMWVTKECWIMGEWDVALGTLQ